MTPIEVYGPQITRCYEAFGSQMSLLRPAPVYLVSAAGIGKLNTGRTIISIGILCKTQARRLRPLISAMNSKPRRDPEGACAGAYVVVSMPRRIRLNLCGSSNCDF